MKKIFVLFLLSALSMGTLFAQDKEKGFWFDVSLQTGDDMMYGKDNGSHITYGLDAAFGYRFNPHIAIGAGTGFQYKIKQHGAGFPVYATVRWDFIDRFVSPYFSLDLGGVLPTMKFQKDNEGILHVSHNPFNECPFGLLAKGNLGISFRVENGSRIYLGCESGIIAGREDWLCTKEYKSDEKKILMSIPLMVKVGFSF